MNNARRARLDGGRRNVKTTTRRRRSGDTTQANLVFIDPEPESPRSRGHNDGQTLTISQRAGIPVYSWSRPQRTATWCTDRLDPGSAAHVTRTRLGMKLM
jgi:hypothetical protein